jgi:antitoxin component of MazEF toxin-antitoxin module
MRKRLVAIGNSLGIIIERPILELLNIGRETELEMSTDGESLILRPTTADKRKRVADAACRMMDVHDDTFRRLSK